MFQESGADVHQQPDSHGYRTEEALDALHTELVHEIDRFATQKGGNWIKVFRSFHHATIHSLYHWTTCFIITLLVVGLFVAYFYIGDTKYVYYSTVSLEHDEVTIILNIFIRYNTFCVEIHVLYTCSHIYL